MDHLICEYLKKKSKRIYIFDKSSILQLDNKAENILMDFKISKP